AGAPNPGSTRSWMCGRRRRHARQILDRRSPPELAQHQRIERGERPRDLRQAPGPRAAPVSRDPIIGLDGVLPAAERLPRRQLWPGARTPSMAAMIPRVTVVLVNFNAGRHLRTCLDSVAADLDGLDWAAVVVDNASTTDGVETIEHW